MTRQEAIDRWKDIAETVFWAEDSLRPEWEERLRAVPTMTKINKQRFAKEYLTAIATEIVSRTSDEELAAMK